MPQASGVYVLADGDVLTWNGSPVALGRCSRIAGEDVESRVRWHAMLNEARFEQLSDQPAHAQYGSVNCSIGRSLQAKPHVVGLTGVSVGQSREPAKDPRWKAVQRVFAELSELSARLRNERRPELAPRHAMNP